MRRIDDISPERLVAAAVQGPSLLLPLPGHRILTLVSIRGIGDEVCCDVVESDEELEKLMDESQQNGMPHIFITVLTSLFE